MKKFINLEKINKLYNCRPCGHRFDGRISIHAEERALKDYPGIRAAQLNVDKANALTKGNLEMGKTTLFNSAEEQRRAGEGVYIPIGIQQQNIDIFSTGARRAWRESQLQLAREQLNLNELQLKRAVQKAYVSVIIARKKLDLFSELDSSYTRLEKATDLQLETEFINQLEWLTTQKVVKTIQMKKV